MVCTEEFQKEGEPNPSAGVLLLTREVEEEDRVSGKRVPLGIVKQG